MQDGRRIGDMLMYQGHPVSKARYAALTGEPVKDEPVLTAEEALAGKRPARPKRAKAAAKPATDTEAAIADAVDAADSDPAEDPAAAQADEATAEAIAAVLAAQTDGGEVDPAADGLGDGEATEEG